MIPSYYSTACTFLFVKFQASWAGASSSNSVKKSVSAKFIIKMSALYMVLLVSFMKTWMVLLTGEYTITFHCLYPWFGL